MKGFLFLAFVVIVLLVASIGLTKEGFINPGSNESLKAPTVVVPKTNPKPSPLEGTTPAPYMQPTEKAYGPAYGDIARINTLPYRDPSLESAPFKRLSELLESLKGFMTYEAKGLEKQSDPQVQLPLTTAKGDLQRLTDELNVLRRNPGLDSAITQGQADEIQANLAYLQRKYRMSVNAVSGSSLEEGFTNQVDSNDRLNLQDLQELEQTIQAEIARLSSSGTTDTVTNARINTLNTIKTNVASLITEVESGIRPAAEIPILKKDRDAFLPLMSDPSKPLPKLLNEANLPITLSNAFPAYGPGDKSGAKAAQLLFQEYGEKIFNGLSWSLGLKFTSPNEVLNSIAKATESQKSDSPVFLTGSGPKAPNGSFAAFPRGEMESTTSGMEVSRLEVRPSLDPGKPASYDWKSKAANICDSIRKRGLDPKDFGCLEPGKTVGNDYSWRGHARMVCTRLLTTPDPGLPETCGCPPLEWPGWRS